MYPEQLFNQKRWLFFVGIKALIIKNGKILVLSSGASELSSTGRTKAFWDLPGGKVEWGESVAETLRREVHEELGISKNSLRIKRIFEASVSRIRISHGIPVPLLLITFLCSINGSNGFKLSDEHASFKWVDAKTAKRLLGVKFNRTFVKELDSI